MMKNMAYIKSILIILIVFSLVASTINAQQNNDITHITKKFGGGGGYQTGEFEGPNQTFNPLGITPMINLCYKWIPQGSTTNQDFGVWYSTTREDEKLYDYQLEIIYEDESDWITIYPTSGVLSQDNGFMYIHEILIDASGLSLLEPKYADFEGSPLKYTHVAYIKASCDGYESTMEVRINVVKGPKDGPTLKYWPPRLEFSKSDPDGTSKTFEIWNSGKGKLSYHMHEPYPWIEVTPDAGYVYGETDTIKVTIYPSKITCGSGAVGYVYIDVNGGAVAPPGKHVGAGRITIWRSGDWPSEYNVGCNSSAQSSSNNGNIGQVPDTPIVDNINENDLESGIGEDVSENIPQSDISEIEKPSVDDLQENTEKSFKNIIIQLLQDTKIYEILSRFLQL